MLAPEPHTGTRLCRLAGRAGLYPLDKGYEPFTAEERAAFPMWEPMPGADEPPFPTAGVRARQAPGMLAMVAHASPEGAVTRFDIRAPTGAQRARHMAAKLIHTPYKPAAFGGKPCAMQFPCEFTLRLQPSQRPKRYRSSGR